MRKFLILGMVAFLSGCTAGAPIGQLSVPVVKNTMEQKAVSDVLKELRVSLQIAENILRIADICQADDLPWHGRRPLNAKVTLATAKSSTVGGEAGGAFSFVPVSANLSGERSTVASRIYKITLQADDAARLADGDLVEICQTATRKDVTAALEQHPVADAIVSSMLGVGDGLAGVVFLPPSFRIANDPTVGDLSSSVIEVTVKFTVEVKSEAEGGIDLLVFRAGVSGSEGRENEQEMVVTLGELK
ncbi:hypothetical protein TH9_13480 [Thalassospira xiamenensis]|nr:hypothetical protein TH9_13480 [Thalassospira xiamenensis]